MDILFRFGYIIHIENEIEILEKLLAEKAQIEIRHAEALNEINTKLINARSRIGMLAAMLKQQSP